MRISSILRFRVVLNYIRVCNVRSGVKQTIPPLVCYLICKLRHPEVKVCEQFLHQRTCPNHVCLLCPTADGPAVTGGWRVLVSQSHRQDTRGQALLATFHAPQVSEARLPRQGALWPDSLRRQGRTKAVAKCVLYNFLKFFWWQTALLSCCNDRIWSLASTCRKWCLTWNL